MKFSEKVAVVQEYLKSKNYYLGSYGPKKDGVDGKLGKLTRRAMEKEFGRKFPEKNYSSDEQKVIRKNSLVISKGNSSNSWALVFGGTPSSKYGAEFMYKQGSQILSDKNVVYSDWENSVRSVIETIKKSYPNAEIKSVLGFSKGGLRAYPEVGVFDFIGLIDPSIEGSYFDYNPKGTNTILTYDPRRTWGLKSLKHAMRLLGSEKVVPIEVGHLDQPKEFFNRFKNKL